MKKKTKFLIIRFSSIGDIILTTPVIRCLKTQYPNTEIHFATKKAYESLITSNPYIDKSYLLEGNLSDLIKKLKTENYDYIIDLHNNLRSHIISYRLGKKTKVFNKLNWQKWIFVKFKKNIMPNLHIVDRYMQTVADLGVINDNKGLDYFIPPKDILNPLPYARNSFVVYAIGGQHETKKLPLTKMIELCQTIKEPIILLGGKEDYLQGEALKEACPEKDILNLTGKCNLNQSASVIEQAQKVYTHDTGMMHVAAALKKEIIAIWGNTVPSFGMYPYQTPFISIENTTLSCRPCSKIGYKKCPLHHFKCMNDLSFPE